MPMFKCEWPNGDVTFVLAKSVDDAITQLDEFDDATPQMIKRVREFMIDLRPNRAVMEANLRARAEGRSEQGDAWELGDFGESMFSPESSALPSDEDTLRRIRAYEQGEPNAVAEKEQELRDRAERDGTLIDLTKRRLAAAARRMSDAAQAAPPDEP